MSARPPAPGRGYSIDNGSATLVLPEPRDERLSLAGARPNPSRGGPMNVRFTLATSTPASLELFDLAGRRVASRDVGALGAGRHEIQWSPGRRLATGLYLLRLTQGAGSRVARVTVVN